MKLPVNIRLCIIRGLLCCVSFIISALVVNAQKKPNIIFILADDLGYGDIGYFFQNKRSVNNKARPSESTPNLDKMATHGAVFTQQYANAPVCAPSRASLLTGVHQGNAVVRDNQFDKALEDNHNIASVLKQAGYTTAAIGKWGLQGEKEEGPNWPAHPLKRGFDHFYGYMRHRDGHEHYPFEGIYRGKKEVWDDYHNVSNSLAKCYTTDLWTARAKKYIIDQSRSEGDMPFFLYLAYDAPHAVLELPTQAYPEGGGLSGGLKWLNQVDGMINTASGNVDSYIYPEYKDASYTDVKTGKEDLPWPNTFKRYATATRRIDDAVGDLMKLLKDLKIDSNTLVVFTSDNGPSIESYLPDSYVPNTPDFFGSYGPFDGFKRDCWEGGIRMPSLVVWPGQIMPGKIVDQPSMLSDWLATFVDAAHIPAPARSDGVSLLPALTGIGKQEPSHVYVEYFEEGKTPAFEAFEPSRRNRRRGQMQMIRLGNFAGVRYNVQHQEDDFEIYDVVKDPKETNNLAQLPGYEGIQKQMKAQTLQLRQSDSAAPRPYDSAYIPSSSLTGKVVNGLRWHFFRGNFPWVISTRNMKAQKQGIVSKVTGMQVTGSAGLLLYSGYIKVPENDRYTFSITTNDKALVRLHQSCLLDADYNYQPGNKLLKSVYLMSGYHPISIYLLKTKPGTSVLQMQWKSGKKEKWNKLKTRDLYHTSL